MEEARLQRPNIPFAQEEQKAFLEKMSLWATDALFAIRSQGWWRAVALAKRSRMALDKNLFRLRKRRKGPPNLAIMAWGGGAARVLSFGWTGWAHRTN